MVHFGIWRCVSIGFGLWISPGRLALRGDRSDLVGCGASALVAGGKLTLTRPHACKSGYESRIVPPVSDEQSLRFRHTVLADAGHALPNLRTVLTRNAG